MALSAMNEQTRILSPPPSLSHFPSFIFSLLLPPRRHFVCVNGLEEQQKMAGTDQETTAWEVRLAPDGHAFVYDTRLDAPACGHAHDDEGMLRLWHTGGASRVHAAPCPSCAPARFIPCGAPVATQKYTQSALVLILTPGSAERAATVVAGSEAFQERLEASVGSILLAAAKEVGIPGGRGIWRSKRGYILRMVAELFDGGWKSATEPESAAPKKRPAPEDGDGDGDGAGAGAEPPTGDGDASKRRRTPAAQAKESSTKIMIGQKTLFSQLGKERNWRLDFVTYSRDRCRDVSLPAIGVGKLTSYQLLMKWWAMKLAAGSLAGHSGLLYHLTGSGKTASLWIILGTFWRWGTPSNQKALLYVTKAKLAQSRQPDSDVWAFYQAAGPKAYDAVRSIPTKRTVKKKKGTGTKTVIVQMPIREGQLTATSLWRWYLPAPGPDESIRRTRVISYLQLYNAILAGNEYGRMLYGIALQQANVPVGSLYRRAVGTGDPFTEDEFPGILDDNLAAAADATAATAAEAAADAAAAFAAVTASGGDAVEAAAAAAEVMAAATTAAAKVKKRGVIDPLAGAVIAIDEVDGLFSETGELGGQRAAFIERAIFRSYDVSGRRAVRVFMGTATPAHTSVAVTMRLLNLLQRDRMKRVSGVGSAGGLPGFTNPALTIASFRGTGRRAGVSGGSPARPFTSGPMYEYMNGVSSSISAVRLDDDTDHFPVRERHTIMVKPQTQEHVNAYDAFVRRRLRVAREDEGDDKGKPGDVPMVGARPSRAAADAASAALAGGEPASSDDEWDDIDKAEREAVVGEKFSDDYSDDDDPQGRADAGTEEEVVTRSQRVAVELRVRAGALRRRAMMFPPVGGSATTYPTAFIPGHYHWNAQAFVDHITDVPAAVADDAASAAAAAADAASTAATTAVAADGIPVHGRAPKLLALLERIHAIDAAASAAGKALPKHVIISDTPGRFGVPLIAAALYAAGYGWRQFQRVRGGTGSNAVQFVGARTDAASGDVLGWNHAKRDLHPASAGLTANYLAPVVSAFDTPDPGAFAVLDATLLAHDAESGWIPHTVNPRRNRIYTDYQVNTATEIMKMLRARVGEDDDRLGLIADVLRGVTGKPLYRSVSDGADAANLYTSFKIDNQSDVALSVQMASVLAILGGGVPRSWSLDDLVSENLVRWAAALTVPQQRAVTRNLLTHFNSPSFNANGEFARVVIIGRDFSAGTSVFEVEHTHLIDAFERVADGIDDTPKTRDRIQAEGRAWRRCGHRGIRSRDPLGAPTRLHIYEYRLDAGIIERKEALKAIRARRPLVEATELAQAKLLLEAAEDRVATEAKTAATEPAAAQRLAAEQVGLRDATSRVQEARDILDAAKASSPMLEQDDFALDDLVQVLSGRDPVEQVFLGELEEWLRDVAFDRHRNTIRPQKGLVYTGYVYTPMRAAIYRRIGDLTLRTVDSSPIFIRSDGPPTTLYQLSKGGDLKFDPDAGKWRGVADFDQGLIERDVAESVGTQIESLLTLRRVAKDRARGGSGRIGTAAAAAAAAGEAAGSASAAAAAAAEVAAAPSVAPTVSWRARAEREAERRLHDASALGWYADAARETHSVANEAGIILDMRLARDLWLASFVRTASTSSTDATMVHELIAAWMSRQANSKTLGPFDAAGYAVTALGQKAAANAVLGIPDPRAMRMVLNFAKWLDADVLADDIQEYAGVWGMVPAEVVTAIAVRGPTPGETEEERRRAVFGALAVKNQGRWFRLVRACARIFGASKAGGIELPLRRALANRVEAVRTHNIRERETAAGVRAAIAASGDGKAEPAAPNIQGLDVAVDVFVHDAVANLQAIGARSPTALYGLLRTVAAISDLPLHTLMGGAIMHAFDEITVAGAGTRAGRGPADRILGEHAVVQMLKRLPVVSVPVRDEKTAARRLAALSERMKQRSERGGEGATTQEIGEALYQAVGSWVRAEELVVAKMRQAEHLTGMVILDTATGPFEAGRGSQLVMTTPRIGTSAATRFLFRPIGAPGVVREVSPATGMSWDAALTGWIADGSIGFMTWDAAARALSQATANNLGLLAVRRVLVEFGASTVDAGNASTSIFEDIRFAARAPVLGVVQFRQHSIHAALDARIVDYFPPTPAGAALPATGFGGAAASAAAFAAAAASPAVATTLNTLSKVQFADFARAVSKAGDDWHGDLAFARVAAAAIQGVYPSNILQFIYSSGTSSRSLSDVKVSVPHEVAARMLKTSMLKAWDPTGTIVPAVINVFVATSAPLLASIASGAMMPPGAAAAAAAMGGGGGGIAAATAAAAAPVVVTNIDVLGWAISAGVAIPTYQGPNPMAVGAFVGDVTNHAGVAAFSRLRNAHDAMAATSAQASAQERQQQEASALDAARKINRMRMRLQMYTRPPTQDAVRASVVTYREYAVFARTFALSLHDDPTATGLEMARADEDAALFERYADVLEAAAAAEPDAVAAILDTLDLGDVGDDDEDEDDEDEDEETFDDDDDDDDGEDDDDDDDDGGDVFMGHRMGQAGVNPSVYQTPVGTRDSSVSAPRALQWPTAATTATTTPNATPFAVYALAKAKRLRDVLVQYGDDPERYPGDERFADVPDGLLAHILLHDFPLSHLNTDASRSKKLRRLFDTHGLVLQAIEFFASRRDECVLTPFDTQTALIGLLPVWLRPEALRAMETFVDKGDLRCGPAADICGELVRANRTLGDAWQSADPSAPSVAPTVAARRVRDTFPNFALLRITMDMGYADHVFVVMRLRDPGTGRMRDFSCQAYIFQNAIWMEEVDDLEEYLSLVASLPTTRDFTDVYRRLFRAELSRSPREADWEVFPSVTIVNGA